MLKCVINFSFRCLNLVFFTGNSANGGGGGVCAESDSNVNISGNTTFTGNSANGVY